MTICYFGIYNKNYPRNSIIINGLRQNGAEVLECNSRKRWFLKYIDLFLKHKKIKNKYEIMVIGFLGQGIIKFAKKLTNKPVILDAFVSQYLTNIYDRKLYSQWSFKAKKIRKAEQEACELADLILLDTQAQINYFIDRYKIDKHKFIRIFAGADDKFCFPSLDYARDRQKIKNDKFIVHWHGFIVPFYSLKTVVQAAEILKNENIEFRIITRFNKQSDKVRHLIKKLKLKNVKLRVERKYESLVKLINQADVCLGIFGNNEKAKIVIPNKIFEAIACSKSIITANTKAVRELFIDKKDILLVKANDVQDLADKILELKNNPDLNKKIATNSYNLYLKNLTPKIVVKDLVKKLKQISDF